MYKRTIAYKEHDNAYNPVEISIKLFWYFTYTRTFFCIKDEWYKVGSCKPISKHLNVELKVFSACAIFNNHCCALEERMKKING